MPEIDIEKWNISPAAAKLHSDALVWDNTVPWSGFGRPELKRNALSHHIASGADFASVTVATDGQTLEQTITTLANERRYFLSQPETFRLCATAADILAAKSAGLLGVNFNFQGTNAFNRDVGLVELYYKLGVRHALLAYNQKNHVGDGCHERTDGGLSRFGVALISEMNRVGMLVDCSHTGYRTSMDAFACSTAPVIFSHANASGVWKHERNITDDQIDACAATGGVIGVNGIGVFLGSNDVATDLLLNHIDYIAQRVGPAHVGIGLDWVYDMESLMVLVKQMAETYPDGAYDREIAVAQPEQLPQITEGLMQRGYADADIRNILGLNWLRVAEQVWKA
jgi:membrane dipeptidase